MFVTSTVIGSKWCLLKAIFQDVQTHFKFYQFSYYCCFGYINPINIMRHPFWGVVLYHCHHFSNPSFYLIKFVLCPFHNTCSIPYQKSSSKKAKMGKILEFFFRNYPRTTSYHNLSYDWFMAFPTLIFALIFIWKTGTTIKKIKQISWATKKKDMQTPCTT